MTFGRLMGLDVGTKTVGVAVSDPLGLTAQPLETVKIDVAANNYGLKPLSELIVKYQPETIVIGLPKHMNNDEGVRAEASREYGEKLQARFPDLLIEYQDERLTTVEAEKVLMAGGVRRENRKASVDKLAASLILENYLESHRA